MSNGLTTREEKKSGLSLFESTIEITDQLPNGMNKISEEREAYLNKAAELLKKNLSQRVIALRLNVNPSQVGQDWVEIQKRFNASKAMDVETKRNIYDEQYEWVRRKAKKAFIQSEENSTKILYDENGEPVQVSNGPNNEFLRTYLTTIQHQRELNGADVPKAKSDEDKQRDVFVNDLINAMRNAATTKPEEIPEAEVLSINDNDTNEDTVSISNDDNNKINTADNSTKKKKINNVKKKESKPKVRKVIKRKRKS